MSTACCSSPSAMLYEYAVLLRIYNDDGDLLDTQLIVEPTYTVAGDQQAVRARAARAVPDEYENVIEDTVILVRPFA